MMPALLKSALKPAPYFPVTAILQIASQINYLTPYLRVTRAILRAEPLVALVREQRLERMELVQLNH